MQSPKTLRSDARRALETCAGWNLRQTARRVTQFLESEMEESGVSLSQFGLMAEIAATDDDTVSALAERIGLDQSTLSRTLRTLEAEGLVEIAVVEADQRKRTVWLTEKGARRLEGALASWRQAHARLAEHVRDTGAWLKAELEKKYYFKATVVIGVDQFSKNRGKVYLVGQVRASGPQEIPSDETLTLTKAILRCGGFTDFADKKHVKVTRKRAAGQEPESFTVDVSEIIEKGKMDKDLPLQSGDLIFVPGRLINL